MKTINFIAILFVGSLVLAQTMGTTRQSTSPTTDPRTPTPTDPRSPTPPTIPPPTTGTATGSAATQNGVGGTNTQNLGTNPNVTNPTNPGTMSGGSINPTLIDACSGKTAGTTCTYDYQSTSGSQPINGTCVPTGGQTTVLACR
jgi:hypothetical protein